MSSALQSTKAIKVFYSYSHKDEELRNELENHLAMLKQEGVIEGWHDRKIGAGNEWVGEIDEHLNTAHIILLLISSDFLASGYCRDIEVKQAMERHNAGNARVIPVILRACDWKRALFSKLQVLPKDGLPVKKWADRDDAFLDVAEGMRRAVEQMVADNRGEENRPTATLRYVKPAASPRQLYLIPYLCDRSEQETRLEDALREHKAHRPFLCVVHGDEQECHDMFLLRLLQISLPGLLKLKADQALEERYAMAWPSRRKPGPDPLDSFRGSLAKVIGCNNQASNEQMAQILAREEKPVVIHTNLLTSNWKPDGKELIESFIKWWSNWPDLPPGRILIICLFLKYERGKERDLWLRWRLTRHNKEFRTFIEELDRNEHCRLPGAVLPELRAIRRIDVEHWVHSHAHLIRGDRVKLDDCFRMINSLFANRDAIEMETLAAHLKEMLGTC